MVFLLRKIMFPNEAVRMIAARKASMSQYIQGGKSSLRRSIMLTAIAVEDRPQMVMEANSCLLFMKRDTFYNNPVSTCTLLHFLMGCMTV